MSEAKTVPEWATTIIAVHLRVTDQVSHNERMKSERYFVWQEEGDNRLLRGDSTSECAVRGSTDLFTKQEFDPWKEQFEESLTAAEIAWYYTGVDWEPTTGFYHHEWAWEVV